MDSRLAATAKEHVASDMRRSELAVAQLSPRSASETADMIVGGSVDDETADIDRRYQMGRASRGLARDVRFTDDGVTKGGPIS